MRFLIVIISTLSAVSDALNFFQSTTINNGKVQSNFLSISGFRVLEMLIPENPDGKVKFILFTKNVSRGEMLTKDNVAQTNFNADLNTTVLIHGYDQNGREDYINETVKAYLFYSDINIISVDWSYFAVTPIYGEAVKYTKGVGKVVGELLDKLHREVGLKLENVHIIGHSLGAHIAGFSGKNVIELTGTKISRITGLDPAGPMFEPDVKPWNRLDKTDARFVDVIHTDCGDLGTGQVLGHADFFPNSGYSPQPGCYGDDVHVCSHLRVFWLFAESIYNNKFVSKLCKSWDYFEDDLCGTQNNMMGEHVNQQEFGIFFLATNAVSPFAKG